MAAASPSIGWRAGWETGRAGGRSPRRGRRRRSRRRSGSSRAAARRAGRPPGPCRCRRCRSRPRAGAGSSRPRRRPRSAATPPSGRGRAGRRSGASAESVRERNRVHAGSRLRVARGDDRLEQGRVDEAAGPLGGPEAGPDRAAEKRRGGDLGARVLVQRASARCPRRKRERAASNRCDERPGRARRRGPAGGEPGSGSPTSRRTSQPIASKVRSWKLMTRRWSPGPAPRADPEDE